MKQLSRRAVIRAASPGTGAPDPMMGDATAADISTSMDLFTRHAELDRAVHRDRVLAGGHARDDGRAHGGRTG